MCHARAWYQVITDHSSLSCDLCVDTEANALSVVPLAASINQSKYTLCSSVPGPYGLSLVIQAATAHSSN